MLLFGQRLARTYRKWRPKICASLVKVFYKVFTLVLVEDAALYLAVFSRPISALILHFVSTELYV